MRPVLSLIVIASGMVAGPDAAANTLDTLTDRADILGWEAVGRLDRDGRGYCSASLISTTHVLTAAHCLFSREDGSPVDPGELTFSAGLRDGTSIATRQVTRAVAAKSFDPEDQGSATSIRNDVALLELAEPIPATTADPFPITRGTRDGHPVTVLSYGQGRDNAMSRESDCTVLAHGGGLIAFDCQGHPGSSGAPIFDTSGRSPRILSIVSGTGPFENQKATYGMDLAAVVPELRRAFQTGDGVWPKTAPAERRAIGLSDRSAGSARFVKP